MDSVSTSYKRLFLRCVKIDATSRTPTVSIEAVLLEAATAQIKQTGSGVILTAAAGNGQSFSILPNAGEGLTPLSCAEMISDMLDRHDAAKAALIADGIAAPTDAQISDEMFSKLNAATSVSADFSGFIR